MPTPNDIAWYQLGIRLGQVITFPISADDDSAELWAELHSAWERLLVAIEEVHRTSSLPNVISSTVTLARNDWLIPPIIPEESVRVCKLAALVSSLNSWNEILRSAASRRSVSHLAWIRLGMEIVDGCAVYSDDSKIYYLRGRIPGRAGSPTWHPSRPEIVDELLKSLSLEMSTILKERSVSDERVSLYEFLPESWAWGWTNLEFGLRELKRSCAPPRWDVSSRTLWVDGKPVRQFRNTATKQVEILEAFEDEGWPVSIENPLDNYTQQKDAIGELNGSIEPPLVQFEGIGGRIRWFRLEKTAN